MNKQTFSYFYLKTVSIDGILFSFSMLHTLGIFFSVVENLKYFFLFSPENRICHLMHIVINGDDLHEMSNPDFCGKKEKYHQVVVSELAQNDKDYLPWQKWPKAPLRHFS